MNVQNAEHLEITEGYVGAIHDSDGKQLWGALYYDVSYKGDSEQITYTGKNLLNPATNGWGYITSNGVVDGTTSKQNVLSDYIPVSADTAYTLSINNVEAGQTTRLNFIYYESDQTFISRNGQSSGSSTSRSATTPANCAYMRVFIYKSPDWTDETANSAEFQLEANESATSYEPYVGGIPAPNPDYPQPVNVVTGTQTITLTGGTVSEDYTVGLGSIELCKIGTYQDYIYKANGNWYKHAEVGKEVYDNASSFTLRNTSAGGTKTYAISTPFAYDIKESATGYSNCFTFLGTVNGVSAMYNASYYLNILGFALYYNPTNPTASSVYFNSNKTTAEILAEQNIIFYYQLATATDTQITDTTLVSQLEAVEGFLRRYGYTSSVAGNLPIIIDRDAL